LRLSYFLLTIVVSWMLTGILRRYALQKNLLDVPNTRSSHAIPIPRGGGLAVVLTLFASLVFLFITHRLESSVLVSLFGAGMFVATIGFMDDHGHIPAKWRLLVHFTAAMWGIAWLGDFPPLTLFDHPIHLAWIGYVATAVLLVWLLNLFNFMDGIDGIAASETIFAAGSGLLFAGLAGHIALELVAIAIIGSTVGFLIWNWPPAKIFMGDVGSGFLGITLGLYAYWAMVEGAVSFWSWMIIFGVFFVDATFTLFMRIYKRAIWYEAHRSHAYQHAARKWGHLRVTLIVCLINVMWLLPIAFISNSHRDWGFLLTLLAFLPIVVLVSILGAGKETS
jgi:Fuc2NAc and GlcNAc transferase